MQLDQSLQLLIGLIDLRLQERLLNGGLLESARASWWHMQFLTAVGTNIGRGVYFDTLNFAVCLLYAPTWHLESTCTCVLFVHI